MPDDPTDSRPHSRADRHDHTPHDADLRTDGGDKSIDDLFGTDSSADDASDPSAEDSFEETADALGSISVPSTADPPTESASPEDQPPTTSPSTDETTANLTPNDVTDNGGGITDSNATLDVSSETVITGLLWLGTHLAALPVLILGALVDGLTGTGPGRIANRFYPADKTLNGRIERQSIPSRWRDIGPYLLGSLMILSSLGWSIAIETGILEQYLASRTPSFLVINVLPSYHLASFLFATLGIVTIVGAIVIRASTWYILTDRQLIVKRNPWDMKFNRIDLVDIRKLEQHMNVPTRFVGVGDLEIYTAASKESEVTIDNVKAPGDFENLITSVRKRALEESPHVQTQADLELEDDDA